MKKLFESWRFRSPTPAFDVGEEVTVYITAFNEENNLGEARIGDSVLTVHGVHAAHVDRLVALRVEEFDLVLSRGRATALDGAKPL